MGGWTLHQLRHSSLIHLGERGASAFFLHGKIRHQDPRTLAIYTKPGGEAIAQSTSAVVDDRIVSGYRNHARTGTTIRLDLTPGSSRRVLANQQYREPFEAATKHRG